MLVYAFILILTVHHSKSFAVTTIPPLVCQINRFENSKSPLIIESGETSYKNDVTFLINEGTSVTLACPCGVIIFPDVNGNILDTPPIEKVTATCISQQQFDIEGTAVSWPDITCGQTYSIFKGETCGDKNIGQKVAIGFNLNQHFTEIIEVCYNVATQSPLYSHHILTPSIAQRKSKVEPEWTQDIGFYNLGSDTVDQLYKERAATIVKLLHYEPQGYGLTKGHLAPQADFIYPVEQDATYHYINAAPQWKTLNSVNWNKLEDSIRQYAISNSVDLEIWTGVDGIATLNDNVGVPTKLYLDINTGTNALPVPKLFWKVVYDNLNKKGIAFVGMNELITRQLTQNDLICNDQWTQLKWLTWSRQSNGYVYACTVKMLHTKIPNAPDLKGVNLLR